MAETFEGPIVNSNRGVEITAQTGSVASAPWPALTLGSRLMLASRTTARAEVPSKGRRRDKMNELQMYTKRFEKVNSSIICRDFKLHVYSIQFKKFGLSQS